MLSLQAIALIDLGSAIGKWEEHLPSSKCVLIDTIIENYLLVCRKHNEHGVGWNHILRANTHFLNMF